MQSAEIGIKCQGTILLVKVQDVLSVVAEGNCTIVQFEAGSSRLRESLSEIAKKLEPYGLIRICRSALVNRSWIEGVSSAGAGKYVVRLKDGKEFTVTSAYRENLKLLADVWIGNDAFLSR
jgi:DNA-binding LytR/AlgR family response regulator